MGGTNAIDARMQSYVPMSRMFSGFEGSGQTPLNVQPQVDGLVLKYLLGGWVQ